jgi:pyruvate kinase
MAKEKQRHRLSLIIATLGPSTDNPKELDTMIIAGIARQWTDGVDIARVVFNDGHLAVINRVDTFRKQSEKRKADTSVYLDIDDKEDSNFSEYLKMADDINPKYIAIPKQFGIERITEAKKKLNNTIQIGVRVKPDDNIDDLQIFLEKSDFAMIEIDSKLIADNKIISKAKENNCEPMYLAKMPTLMKGQVQSRGENFEIGHTLEEGFDIVALYEETSHGPYPARSVKCLDEIAVESEKLRFNPFTDFINKILSFFKK